MSMTQQSLKNSQLTMNRNFARNPIRAITAALLVGCASFSHAALEVRLAAATGKASASATAVQFTLINDSDAPVAVLKAQTPFYGVQGDLFSVDLKGAAAPYKGMLVKRGQPAADDYFTLAAHEVKSATLDLSASYAFNVDGVYSARFKQELSGAIDLRSRRDLPKQKSTADAVFLDVKDALPEAVLQPENASKALSLFFTNCSASQQSTINTAFTSARVYADTAKNYFAANTKTARYSTWFGPTSNAQRYDRVKTHYNNIFSALNTKQFIFECGSPNCPSSTTYAFVYANTPYRVHVCNKFWSTTNTGTDSRAGTIVHESSHFTVVAATNDTAYGQANAKALAISNPDQAAGNADNHEYFAENTPKQN
jgi:peptidyl-Lys metalloendopeptidase